MQYANFTYQCDAIVWGLCTQTLNERQMKTRGIVNLSGRYGNRDAVQVLQGFEKTGLAELAGRACGQRAPSAGRRTM